MLWQSFTRVPGRLRHPKLWPHRLAERTVGKAEGSADSAIFLCRLLAGKGGLGVEMNTIPSLQLPTKEDTAFDTTRELADLARRRALLRDPRVRQRLKELIDFGIAKATEGRLTEPTIRREPNRFSDTPAIPSS